MEDLDTEAEMYRALALMHSNEKNSTEKLRLMLDSLIEKKFGPEQTITYKMPRNFLKKVETCQQVSQIFSETDKSSGEMNFLSDTIMTETSMKSMKIFTSESDDSVDTDNVPRISIPDEESGDGAFCLVCNESKLGLFTLLECQKCQDVYHPLCHQPPVEIDLYDPQLIWFCGRCFEDPKQKKANLKNYKKERRLEVRSLKGSKRSKTQSLKRKLEDT